MCAGVEVLAPAPEALNPVIQEPYNFEDRVSGQCSSVT